MKASYEPLRASPRRLERPFPWGFLGILSAALALLLPICSGDCGDLPRYNSMKTKGIPARPYNTGYKVQYECRLGYRRIIPFLPVTAVCHPNNSWTALKEACTKKECVQLGEPINGQVQYSTGTTVFGSEAHFTCNEGFYLLGPKTLYCELFEDNVQWNDDPPNCERILCKPPKKIPNGQYSNSHQDTFEYNEVVTYTCNPSSGKDEFSLVGEPKLVCTGHDKWSSDPPECKVVKCEYPVVQNGQIVSGIQKKFLYKAAVTFECNKGFYLEGNSTIVCGANSAWEPKMPKCIKGSTPLSTKSTISSVSGVKPTVTTTHTITSKPGVKPTVTTTPTITSKPGSSAPSKESPNSANDLDGSLIAVVVLIVLLGVAIVDTCVYKCLHIRKRE